jgi:hypothetical protein
MCMANNRFSNEEEGWIVRYVVKSCALWSSVNGGCLICFNQAWAMSGHFDKWNTFGSKRFTFQNAHVTLNFVFNNDI